ncbi:hypothetical protein INTERNEXUS_294 [Bacillus phage vB_BspM_Internexus]|nr:hypothetical protein DA469_21805 [Bacillus subtilis]QXN70334.1 hypothetical protein INTERNEXUS_294 [Bacillus phage vB_BspM_Internexus]
MNKKFKMINESLLLSEAIQHIPLTPKEKEYIENKFGKTECSFAKNKDGEYYCYTHRAMSKRYSKIEDIPKKDVDFISSTS